MQENQEADKKEEPESLMDKIKKMTKDYPNDAVLGKHIRALIRSLK